MRLLRQSIVVRRLLCLLLCAATWRGPVVWLHSHSDHECTQQADVRLSSHLLRFHQEAPPAHGLPQWHLHIGFLRDLMADGFGDDHAPSAPANDEPILLAAASGSVALTADDCGSSTGDVWIARDAAFSSFTVSAEIPRGSFLQTYGTAPLRVLINVIRC